MRFTENLWRQTIHEIFWKKAEEAYLRNEEAFNQLLKEGNLQRYKGQHVLIGDGQVVAFGPDRNEMLRAYDNTHPDIKEQERVKGFYAAFVK